jgi:hypothetical protein
MPERSQLAPYGVGCLLSIPGFFGGGMVAVGIAKLVGEVTQCKPPEGLPACNTFQYLLAGGLIGLVVLPGIVVWRMRRARGREEK